MASISQAGVAPSLTRITLTVFLPFAGGYFLSYFYRSVNAIIAPQLVAEIGLDAGDLGLLTSAYFFAFAAIQLPLGVMLDRFGPRRVQASLLLCAAAGAFAFSMGESRSALMLGRALIGLGVAGGLMASFKAITLWYPQERWPLANGCFMAMGGLGAMAATAPMEFALTITDWRGVFASLAIATVIVSGIIYFTVPERKGLAPPAALMDQIKGVRLIYTNAAFWRLAPLAMTTLAANMSVQTLWAGPWFRDVGGFDRDGVAANLFILAFTMTLGFVCTGVTADFFSRRGVSLKLITACGLALFLIAQTMIVFGVDVTGIAIWVLMGLTMNVAILIYPQLCAHFPISHTGRVNTAINLMVFGGVFATQYGMGEVIDLWPAGPDGGYHPDAYSAAFGVILALQLLAFIWFLVPLRRT
ncbi:MAG: MFS transporter [Alphaproteobacteria bacterium]|nr:MFS transporter [Alphaproteobacteria bacterium]